MSRGYTIHYKPGRHHQIEARDMQVLEEAVEDIVGEGPSPGYHARAGEHLNVYVGTYYTLSAAKEALWPYLEAGYTRLGVLRNGTLVWNWRA